MTISNNVEPDERERDLLHPTFSKIYTIIQVDEDNKV